MVYLPRSVFVEPAAAHVEHHQPGEGVEPAIKLRECIGHYQHPQLQHLASRVTLKRTVHLLRCGMDGWVFANQFHVRELVAGISDGPQVGHDEEDGKEAKNQPIGDVRPGPPGCVGVRQQEHEEEKDFRKRCHGRHLHHLLKPPNTFAASVQLNNCVGPIDDHPNCDHGEKDTATTLVLGIAVFEPLAFELVAREAHVRPELQLHLAGLKLLLGILGPTILLLRLLVGEVCIDVRKLLRLLVLLQELLRWDRVIRSFSALGSDPCHLHPTGHKNHRHPQAHVHRAIGVLFVLLEPIGDVVIALLMVAPHLSVELSLLGFIQR
mmetsp:Transcript_63820/g.149873  ORF Transcript_63820/g.149873 Transcript_63820/m.149873 type:complete len:322 (-) Transcript_63820:238-1203(-)